MNLIVNPQIDKYRVRLGIIYIDGKLQGNAGIHWQIASIIMLTN